MPFRGRSRTWRSSHPSWSVDSHDLDADRALRALIPLAQPPPGFNGVVYVVDLDTYEANVTDQFDRQVFISVVDGVSPTWARAALDRALARWPNGELQDQAALERSIASQIDIIVNLIYGLLGLAVLIALIGIANTLALSVHERRRELGLLRAVGDDPATGPQRHPMGVRDDRPHGNVPRGGRGQQAEQKHQAA